MTSTLLLILLAGTVGSLAPEPARSFAASSVRAGTTMGAMYFVVGTQPQPNPAVRAVPAQPMPITP